MSDGQKLGRKREIESERAYQGQLDGLFRGLVNVRVDFSLTKNVQSNSVEVSAAVFLRPVTDSVLCTPEYRSILHSTSMTV